MKSIDSRLLRGATVLTLLAGCHRAIDAGPVPRAVPKAAQSARRGQRSGRMRVTQTIVTNRDLLE